MKTKLCTKCQVQKPVSEFYRNRARKDGLYAYCKACDKQRCLERYRNNEQHRNQRLLHGRKVGQDLKLAALAAYGGPICACCQETELCFLTLDHIDGGGNQHRRSLGHGHMYRWLRDHNYPDGFQVLCMNCNFGKRINGGICPHKELSQCLEK